MSWNWRMSYFYCTVVFFPIWLHWKFISTLDSSKTGIHGRLARWRKWKSCDVAELILQAFSHFTYVTAHSPTLPSLYLHHSSFSNRSVASPTSQLIPQSFFRFCYVTGFSLTSPGEPPMRKLPSFLKISCSNFTNIFQEGGKVAVVLLHDPHDFLI